VLKAAKTKWNFLDFRPGLVGGHCIGIDPYYLSYRSEIAGHHPEMILAGRRINDSMPKYVVSKMVNDMISKGLDIKGSKVLVMGATFKPNVSDKRNSKIQDIAAELRNHGCHVDIYDPLIGKKEIFGCRNITDKDFSDGEYDYVVLAVKHDKFKDTKRKIDFTI
jgi:UDP-N-acetyl-D-galactosamine dehydrogenase